MEIKDSKFYRDKCYINGEWVNADSGMMTGSVVNFDQSVWGGYPFSPPKPDGKLDLG